MRFGSHENYTYDPTETTPAIIVDGTTNYVYGPDGLPLEQIIGTTVLWYHHDALGSTRTLTNNTGAVVATITYNAYGQQTATTGTATIPFGYSGACTDPESGFLYLINRYYDPTTAQFLTVDPLVSETNSPYTYANNNPIDRSDPTGLQGGENYNSGGYKKIVAECSSANPPKGCHGYGLPWRGAAQLGTLLTVGLGSAACVAVTDGACALALPYIGSGTGAALYGESGGEHTLGGFISAFAEGGIAGSVSLICEAGLCELAGSVAVGGALVNGLYGSAQGLWDYSSTPGCHSPGGYASAARTGFGQGGIPWDQIWEKLHADA